MSTSGSFEINPRNRDFNALEDNGGEVAQALASEVKPFRREYESRSLSCAQRHVRDVAINSRT